MAEDHYWVVTCKNTNYHAEKNPFGGHRVPVGRTDAHSPRPAIAETIDIQCDDSQCHKTYSYTASEIFRWYGDLEPFSSHPLFD
jgi:hypothetical protein